MCCHGRDRFLDCGEGLQFVLYREVFGSTTARRFASLAGGSSEVGMEQRAGKSWVWRHVGAAVSLLLVVGVAHCEAFSANKISAPSETVESTACKGGKCNVKSKNELITRPGANVRGVRGSLQAHSNDAHASVHTRPHVRSDIVPFGFPWKHRAAAKVRFAPRHTLSS